MPDYIKIPRLGTGRGKLRIGQRCRLYQGHDHLLVVQGSGYTEDYRRVYYGDIRYVEVVHTRGQAWQALISAVLVGLISLVYFAAHAPVLLVVLLASPFVLWFIINLALGPACDCLIATSVQMVALPAPGRLAKVPILIRFLREKTAPMREPPAASPTAVTA